MKPAASQSMNNSIKAILSDKYRVSQLTAGTQVLDFLHLKDTDLVLLDMYMHDLGGMEVLRRIKADPLTADIPVIFLTGEDSAEVEEECLHLGAADYVHKPISPQVLEQRVGNRLMAAESVRRVRQMYGSADPQAEDPGERIQHDELTGLWNRQHIYKAYSGMMESGDAHCALAFIDMSVPLAAKMAAQFCSSASAIFRRAAFFSSVVAAASTLAAALAFFPTSVSIAVTPSFLRRNAFRRSRRP